MTKQEAFRILGATPADDERELKSKYKKLLFLYHPDSRRDNDQEAEEKIRLIIEAYNLIRNLEKEEESEDTFEALVNENAFCPRNVYVLYNIYDEEDLPLSKVARGKYIWDPDIEEFVHFTKSVLEACRDIIDKYGDRAAANMKQIFHLLMQEYIFPIDAARKLGEEIAVDEAERTFSFTGLINNAKNYSMDVSGAEPVTVYLRENSAVAETMVTGKAIGNVSFDNDAFYYCVLPLLEDPRLKVNVRTIKEKASSRTKRQLAIKIDITIPDECTDNCASFRELLMHLI